MTMTVRKAVEWTIGTERRLYTILYFRDRNISGVAEIAEGTGRTIQNISDAVHELEEEKVVECLGERKHSWRKYRLTERGRELLSAVTRELYLGTADRTKRELEYKYVKEAYQLIVRNPATVTSGMRLNQVVDRILQEPRTRTVYVVDGKGRLIGHIGLHRILTITREFIDLKKDGSVSFTNYGDHVLHKGLRSITESSLMVRPDDKLITALRKMTKNGLDDIAVVDDDRRLIGELNGMEILSLARNAYIAQPERLRE